MELVPLAGGDFAQTLPIMKGGSAAQTVDLSIKNSPLWKNFKRFELTKNMRANPGAEEFAKCVRNIGLGIANSSDDTEGYCNLPRERCTTESLAEKLFRPLFQQSDYKKSSETVIVAPYNDEVDDINEEVIEMIEGDAHYYYSIDSTSEDHRDTLMPETLNSLKSASLPAHELKLKVNSVVMLVRNLSIMMGLCNGTRLRVLHLGRRIIRVQILTGDKSGDIFTLPRITIEDRLNFPFPIYRHQFPVKLAHAMTINKAQGQTFDRIGICLLSDVFAHGQLYVALSRARCWEGILIQLPENSESTRVKNVVCYDILGD